jgi:hypothetical protein
MAGVGLLRSHRGRLRVASFEAGDLLSAILATAAVAGIVEVRSD